MKEVEELFKERAKVSMRITGKVQGVFFREYAKREAQKLGIMGIARNKADGTVEIIGEGYKMQLRKFIAACQKGSPLSKVETFDYYWDNYSGKFNTFYTD